MTAKQNNDEKLTSQEQPSSQEQVEHSTNRQSPHYVLGILLLVLLSVIFSSGLPVIKSTVSSLSPEVTIAIRFAIAALIFAPFLRNLSTRLVRDGIIVGLLFFAAYTSEVIGLESLSASRAAFTIALSVVFVTLFKILSGKSLSVWAIVAAVLAFAGIGIMSWKSGEPFVGEVWLLICALFDSAYILVLERLAPLHPPLQLVAIGFWVPAVFSFVWAAPELIHQLEAIKANLGELIYLGVVVTAIFAYLETVAQRSVPGNEVAILRALDPVFGAILSFWFLGETFKTQDFIGASMVLTAIVLAHIPHPQLSHTPDLVV